MSIQDPSPPPARQNVFAKSLTPYPLGTGTISSVCAPTPMKFRFLVNPFSDDMLLPLPATDMTWSYQIEADLGFPWPSSTPEVTVRSSSTIQDKRSCLLGP